MYVWLLISLQETGKYDLITKFVKNNGALTITDDLVLKSLFYFDIDETSSFNAALRRRIETFTLTDIWNEETMKNQFKWEYCCIPS